MIKPASSLIACNILSVISDHNGVLLKVEWDEIRREPQVERIVSLYHNTDVLGLQAFLREKFKLWAGNGSCVEEIWNSYKDIIFEGIKRYVSNKTYLLHGAESFLRS
jgi:DNA topoisomerase IB